MGHARDTDAGGDDASEVEWVDDSDDDHDAGYYKEASSSARQDDFHYNRGWRKDGKGPYKSSWGSRCRRRARRAAERAEHETAEEHDS